MCWSSVFTLHFHYFNIYDDFTARLTLKQLRLRFDEVLHRYSTSNTIHVAFSSFRALRLTFSLRRSIEPNMSRSEMQTELVNALERESVSCSSLLT